MIPQESERQLINSEQSTVTSKLLSVIFSVFSLLKIYLKFTSRILQRYPKQSYESPGDTMSVYIHKSSCLCNF